jgi:hypothetical protein
MAALAARQFRDAFVQLLQQLSEIDVEDAKLINETVTTIRVTTNATESAIALPVTQFVATYGVPFLEEVTNAETFPAKAS